MGSSKDNQSNGYQGKREALLREYAHKHKAAMVCKKSKFLEDNVGFPMSCIKGITNTNKVDENSKSQKISRACESY